MISHTPAERNPMHDLMLEYQRQLGSLWGTFVGGWPLLFGWPALLGASAAIEPYKRLVQLWGFETKETDEELIITTHIPGLGDNEVEARCEGDRLLIKAERHQQAESDEFNLSYNRSIKLPLANCGDLKSSYHNGVLEMRIPKPQGAEQQVKAKRG